MRLLGRIEDRKQFVVFHAFLEQQGIHTKLESTNQTGIFDIWIKEEDEFAKAQALLTEYLEDPKNEKFQTTPPPLDQAKPDLITPLPTHSKSRRVARHIKAPITASIIILCALFYAWNGYQYKKLAAEKSGAVFYGLTPLFMHLCYDLPPSFPLYVQFFKGRSVDSVKELEKLAKENQTFQKIQKIPYWQGVYHLLLTKSNIRSELSVPLFIKIRQKQFWRLVTPVLMHGNFFHIFFNMLWLYLLGKQIEERIKRWQYLSITLMIAVFSNTLQYVVSGPLFLGYSGVITGLAGFIWVRQKKAPWEGYSVSRGTLIFLMVYIFGMLALGIISFFLSKATMSNLQFNIANTAHVSGAMIGAIFGRISPLSRAKL